LDEAAWITASKNGDVQAFNKLVLAYQEMAYALAFRMLRNQEAAADAVQEAFLSAFTRVHQFRGGSFKAWLARIVLNQVYDQLRKQRRQPTETLDPSDDYEDAPVLQIPDAQPGPEQTALSRELMSCIEDGLQTLPAEQRAALILCDIHGLSYEEISAATETSLGTVKSRLSRGRQALRSYLARHMELLPPQYRQYYTGVEADQRPASTLVTDG
jgi:RNA polymerase sigma-70 factor (ECF subfamily)